MFETLEINSTIFLRKLDKIKEFLLCLLCNGTPRKTDKKIPIFEISKPPPPHPSDMSSKSIRLTLKKCLRFQFLGKS